MSNQVLMQLKTGHGAEKWSKMRWYRALGWLTAIMISREEPGWLINSVCLSACFSVQIVPLKPIPPVLDVIPHTPVLETIRS